MPGILGTILDTTGKRVKERVDQSMALDNAQRDAQAKIYLDALHATDENGNPKLSGPAADDVAQKYQDLYKHNKGIKDIVGKFMDLRGKIFSGAPKPPQPMIQNMQDQTLQASQAPMQSQDGGAMARQAAPTMQSQDAGGMAKASVPTDQRTVASSPTPDMGVMTPPPARTPEPAAPVAQAPASAPTSMASIIQASASPNALHSAQINRAADEEVDNRKMDKQQANAIEMENLRNTNKLAQLEATAKSHGDKKIAQYTGDDQKLHLIFQAPDGTKYESDSEGQVRPYVSRLSPGSKISIMDAKSLATNLGQQFLDESGNPMDVTKLSDADQLVPLTGGMPNRYKVSTQNQTTKTFDNTVSAVPVLNQTSASSYIPLGQATVAREGTSETAMIDATGNAVAIPLRNSSAPIGGPSPTQQRTPASPTSAPTGTAPTNTGASVSPSGNRQLNALPVGEYNNQMGIVRPVRAAAVQLFGDPKNPNIESLESFAKLADDPAARERIGTAARLIIGDLSAAEKSGGVGASVFGQAISANGGDLWQALKNTSGLTNWVASSSVKATQQAVEALKPDEARALNQMIAAYGTVVGLRTLTKGGAYKFSVDSMERELPIPGVSDVSNSTTYYNKLAKIANEVVEGAKGIADPLLPEKANYKAAADRLNALGQGRNGALTAPPPRGSSPTATPTGRIKVQGPGGQTGTVPAGTPLGPGWSIVTP